MGVHKFRLPAPELMAPSSELQKGFIIGLDRTPMRTVMELRGDLLICHRDTNESGRLHVPWAVPGFGTSILNTATLMERPEPYDLTIELARGKINDLRNQWEDWKLMGLQSTPELAGLIRDAQTRFTAAVTQRDDVKESWLAASEAILLACRASSLLMDLYTRQVLQTRLTFAPRLPTLLGCSLRGDPSKAPWSRKIVEAVNSARIGCSWAQVAEGESQFQWDLFDAQLNWCHRNGLAVAAGPLVEFRKDALPNWLWLWQGDSHAILGLAVDWVRRVMTRYRGKIAVWHLVHRVGTHRFLGLSEDDQIGITARLFQTARQCDPHAQLIIDFERPWAEWMGGPHTASLGPLYLADSIARTDLSVSGIGLEIAPGYGPPGSMLHDLMDYSRLLDLYSQVNFPLHITLAFPSQAGPDLQAFDPNIIVNERSWPSVPNESLQQQWATRWIALSAAKPFVRSITLATPSDGDPHLFPHSGILRTDGTPKPLFDWMQIFRRDYLQ